MRSSVARRGRFDPPQRPARARLLVIGRAACEELGITIYDDTGLIVSPG